MQKNILITGSTDGIGLEAAKLLAAEGHNILLHGRSPAKLEEAKKAVSALSNGGYVKHYLADLSNMHDVATFAEAVNKNHARLDVLINNAGIYKTAEPITQDGLDVRFVVNVIAPYLLTRYLLPLFQGFGRVINLSSAAQSPVDLNALAGQVRLEEGAAYAQSKLALTMWSRALALSLQGQGPIIVAVNPGSLLGSKMVKEAFGIKGGDIQVGAKILTYAALSDEFLGASGKYFDNDSGQFASPHPDALDHQKCEAAVAVIEDVLAKLE